MKFTKKLAIATKIIAAALAVFMPFILCFALILLIPPQYSDTFVGALDEKYERLTSINEPKVVVVGGSSVAFGLQSELIEKYTGMPTVNFGLYAALGTKAMLDLSRGAIGNGDIVILSPELDAETMSLFFNAKTVLEATDDKPSMLLNLDIKNSPEIAAAAFGHAADKIKYSLTESPNPDSVYNSKNFNEYGDIEFKRERNVMELYYDPNKLIHLDSSIIDTEFIDYLNAYIRACKRRGARVYFSFCPMNSLSLAENITDESIAEFERLLANTLECEILGEAENYIMEPEYFYDTNFHLNDAGALYRTITLCRDLLFATDNPTRVSEEYPEPPALAEGLIKVYEDISDEGLFTYEKLGNGNYMITGLTERGKAERELTIPLGVKPDGFDYGIAITVLGEGAFEGCSAEKIIIPENTYLTQMNNDVFRGASSVSELYIYKLDSESLNPPKSFIGTKDGFVIHAPENSEYKTGYFWSQVKNVTIILDLKTN